MTLGGLSTAGALALALLVAPRRAAAQDSTVHRTTPAAADTVPPRTLPVNGVLLRPQRLQYRMSMVWPDSTHVVGTRTVDVTQSSYGAFPAWLLVQTRDGSVPSIDTLYLSYVDLRPLHWTSVIGPSRLALEFTPDSIYGATSGPTGNQNISLARPSDLLVGASMTELVLQLMPHAVGRVDSVSVLEIDLATHRIEPAALTVEGEQDVDTPMGRIHCWVVSLSTTARTARYWVAESDPVVVQIRQDAPGLPGVVFEERLSAAN
jgi:hypothetical protein